MEKRAMTAAAIIIASAIAMAAGMPRMLGGTPKFEVKKKITLGGEGGWDYLKYDPDGKRVFSSRATHTIVFDPASGKQVGDIPNTNGVHGIALVPELGKGFISDGRDNQVTVFDLKSLKQTGTVPTSAGPDAIMYEPLTKRVFTMDGHASDATGIDAATNKVVGKIPLAGKPEFAVADGRGVVFVNIEDKSEMQAFDAKTLKVLHTWPMGKCDSPSGLAIDTKRRRLFAGCDNKEMAILDADTGKVLAEPAIGEGVDACGFDPGLNLAFSSNGQDGNLTVIKEEGGDKFAVVQNLETEKGARTMTLDEKSHTIYTVTAKFGPVPTTLAGAKTAPSGGPGSAGQRRPSIVPGTFEVIVVGMKGRF